MTIKNLSIVCGLIGTVVGGCGSLPEEVESVSDQALWFDSTLLKRPPFIPVCFEVGSAYSQADRSNVQLWLSSSWQAVATITFYGFGDCGPARLTNTVNQEVRLRTGHVPPGNGGVTFNGDYRDKSDQDGPRWVATTVDLLVPVNRPTVLHEFGHVLGFKHEQMTDELVSNPCIQRTSGGQQASGKDISNSIMSYCSNATDLSEQDIIGVQHVYGPFPEFAPNHSLPSLYPQAGLDFDTFSTRGYAGDGNWDITEPPHDVIDQPKKYHFGYTRITFGAECGLHDVVDGTSARVKINTGDLSLPHSIKCARTAILVSAFPHQDPVRPRPFTIFEHSQRRDPINDRGSPSVGWDWDVGFIKAECPFRQVITGVGRPKTTRLMPSRVLRLGTATRTTARPPWSVPLVTPAMPCRIGRTGTSRTSAASGGT